jgi:PRC-barrel domain
MIEQSNYTDLVGLDAFTVNNKKIGKIIALDKKKNKDHLIVLNKGIVHDEEFHIPIDSITEILEKESKIIINLNEDEIKHGYEFLDKNNPSSDLIKGKSNSTLSSPLEKEKIKYQSFSYRSENSKNKNSKVQEVDEYLCDMCAARFKDSSDLESHRKSKHSAPVGI